MITDRIQLAGLGSYFQHPATPGNVNLGTNAPVIVRTAPLKKCKQSDISGIEFLIEHEDLQKLMSFQLDSGNPSSIIRISVMKEMFAGLFADPFRHRVHNIAGWMDFNEGTLINGKVMEIDGIPTILSTGGRDACVWTSKEYIMPDPISINAIAWELATSKLTPPESFFYHMKIVCKSENGGVLPDITIGTQNQPLKANAKRAVEDLSARNIKSFQIIFTAKVFEDSYLMERHLPVTGENIGRPLLRAINFLEPVKSVYDVHSLMELKSLCSDFQLYENPGPEIKRLMGTIDLNATLVNSENQNITIDQNGRENFYDVATRYEFIELSVVHKKFTRFEARLTGESLLRTITR